MEAVDEAFLKAFEDCTIPKAEWTHAAHVRMAWLYLEAHGYSAALPRITGGIRRYNASLGNTSGYHETVTRCFTQIVEHRRQSSPGIKWSAFAARNADLVERCAAVLGRHYSPALLATDAATDDFVPPDRRPLPALGVIRPACRDDAPGVQAVYAPYVTDTAISFETTVPTVEEMARRLEAPFPWYVFETLDGQIAGYAYASAHHARAAYRWSVDVSAYVDARLHALGVGRALYNRLLDACEARGFYNAFAGIVLPNEKSVGLHEAMGFRPIGACRDVGYKLGRWHDVGWWQRVLRAPRGAPPEPQWT